MKKLALAVLGVVPLLANAQSSVTLYGILDEGIHFQNNVAGGKKVSMDSLSGPFGSRWGLTGAEDLGGGIQAIFTLESGINIPTGQSAQGGTLFGRQAFVGVKSAQYGSVTLGRQYDMVFYFPEFLAGYALMGGPTSVHPGDLDNAANTVRWNNTVRYMSPSFGGFTFGGLYSLGGVPGDFTSQSGYSVGAGYANGGFKVAAAYQFFKNPTATAGKGLFTDNQSGVSNLTGSLNSGYQVAQSYQVAMIAANYAITDKWTVAGSYSNTEYGNLGASFLKNAAKFHNFDIAISYKFTPFLSSGLAYDYLKGTAVGKTGNSNLGNQHYNQISWATNYVLSKRTEVYGAIGYQIGSGTNSLGQSAVANISSLGDSSTNKQVLVRLAMRHRF
ncbi:porin [Burkholderia sp. SRS-W-2-2016]|uniref:porin n=1 Tax=Burkholderia sp. SRS-W-2-2016 TaxID=1926878 RepID=UPI00094B35EF|nr:porin [Burkholderia sp. SRS-W-2-2016]OLL31679.1 porin [Burkholderia sp. SRS-W-2-2016]